MWGFKPDQAAPVCHGRVPQCGRRRGVLYCTSIYSASIAKLRLWEVFYVPIRSGQLAVAPQYCTIQCAFDARAVVGWKLSSKA